MISTPSTATTGTRDGLPAFFTLAFGLSWGCWIPVALAERGNLELPVPALALTIIGAFGPMAAALIVAAGLHGAPGVRQLFRSLRLRGLDRRWLWLALAVGLVDLSPAAVHLLDGGPLPEDVIGQVLIMPVHFVFIALAGGGLDEEMGWRGFALPALQERLAPLPANLMLGVVWAAWHLPLFLDPSSTQSQSSFGVYLVTLVAQAIVIGWLFNASCGSLLVAIVAHAAANTGDGLRLAVTTDAAGTAWLQMTAYIVVALLVVWRTEGQLGLTPRANAVATPEGTNAWIDAEERSDTSVRRRGRQDAADEPPRGEGDQEHHDADAPARLVDHEGHLADPDADERVDRTPQRWSAHLGAQPGWRCCGTDRIAGAGQSAESRAADHRPDRCEQQQSDHTQRDERVREPACVATPRGPGEMPTGQQGDGGRGGDQPARAPREAGPGGSVMARRGRP